MGWPDMETGIGTGYSFDDLPDALENGGAKEISVTGLSGLLADDQHVLDAEVLAVAAALVHASRHQNSGADEISLTGLEGEEIRLTPKASSSGAEGTIFYDSDDNHVYVATE